MSHFAEIIDGRVARVIVAEQDFVDQLPGKWVQTSYNTRGGIHFGPDGEPDGGVALRSNFAAPGMEYDEVKDEFIVPSPYPSWRINRYGVWEAPVPMPPLMVDGVKKYYVWDESTLSWVDTTINAIPDYSIGSLAGNVNEELVRALIYQVIEESNSQPQP